MITLFSKYIYFKSLSENIGRYFIRQINKTIKNIICLKSIKKFLTGRSNFNTEKEFLIYIFKIKTKLLEAACTIYMYIYTYT